MATTHPTRDHRRGDELRLAPDLELPVDAVTQSFAWLAVTGAGKSNAITVFAEEMHDHGVPWVLVDPKGDTWGIRSNAEGTGPGLPVPIFGGLHGDLPLGPEAGALIAELIVDRNLTCVLDVSEFSSKGTQIRFLTDFAERLYRLHGKHRQARHVILEEADEVMPQRVMHDMARCVGAWTNIVKRGRQRGLGCSLVSQRSAAVNKDGLTQCQTLVALRTTSPQDRKAILAWVDYHAVAKELVDSLPELENGEAWVCSPQFLKFMKRVHFDRRRTFDSGATPLVGASRSVATLADIDLGDLRGQMSAVGERAAQDDPQLLRHRIDELERQLRSMAATDRVPPERIEVPVEVRVEVPHLPSIEALSALASTAGELAAGLSDLQKAIAVEETMEARDISRTLLPRQTPRSPTDQRIRVGVRDQPARHIAQPSTAATTGSAAGLGKAERSILSVLAQFVDGRTKRQLAMQAGYSAKGGGFGNALGRLRSLGLITRGEPIRITAAGFERISGAFEPLPTGTALLDHWLGQLGRAERMILAELVNIWPSSLTKEEVAERTGYAVAGGGFGNALGRLRRLELIEGYGEIVAEETLAREARQGAAAVGAT